MKVARSPQSTRNPTDYAVEVLDKIRAGAAKGRDSVNPQRMVRGAHHRAQIYALVLAHQQAGDPRRGLALARVIRRKLGGSLSENYIAKIIRGARNSGP